jgi:CPA2 family monovalent cation:H+ antiporter-2
MVSAITTLLTPYLIRSSDGVVRLLARRSPSLVTEAAQVYSRWMSSPRRPSGDQQIKRILRRWAVQLLLNLALITGIFIAAVAMARRWGSVLPELPRWAGGSDAVVWLGAMLVSLPLLVATVRKLRAMAMMLAELSVSRAAAREHAAAIRSVVANVIFIGGSSLITVLVLLLGAAILPAWHVLAVMMLIVFAVAALMWPSLVRIYAKAQISLHETLTYTHEHEAENPPAEPVLPAALREAQIEAIAIEPGSPGAGKLIRELQLRTLSGASAVAIERASGSVVNPGPDEELQPGDRVLLLGSRAQLDAAHALLGTGDAGGESRSGTWQSG